MSFVFIRGKKKELCHLQLKLIGFYSRDEKCLLRGTDWVFKGLIFIIRNFCCCDGLSLGVYFLRSGENSGEEFKTLELFFASNTCDQLSIML
jgi:hypothetical protein